MFSVAEQLADEEQLPNLQFLSTILLCDSSDCVDQAEEIRKHCSHELRIGHQEVWNAKGDLESYQAILWHGGEAMLVVNTGYGFIANYILPNGTHAFNDLSIYIEWLDEVHKYNTETHPIE